VFKNKSKSARGLQLFDFNFIVECEQLLKVTGIADTCTARVLISRKWCKIEMLLQQTTIRKSYAAYSLAAVAMTLSVYEGHSPIASLFGWDF